MDVDERLAFEMRGDEPRRWEIPAGEDLSEKELAIRKVKLYNGVRPRILPVDHS